MSTDLHSLWGAIQRGDTREIASHLIPQTRSNPGTVSASLQQKGLPTAGIGTADAGTPIVRYWTVKFERGGRTHFTAVEACDVLKANLVTFKQYEGANGVQVVREINRDEFEHLTKVSP